MVFKLTPKHVSMKKNVWCFHAKLVASDLNNVFKLIPRHIRQDGKWKCSFSVNGIKLVNEVKEVKGILKYDGSVTFEELFCLKCGEEIKEVASLHHRIPVLPAHQSNDVALLEFVSYECTYCPAILNEEEMLAHKNCVKTVS